MLGQPIPLSRRRADREDGNANAEEKEEEEEEEETVGLLCMLLLLLFPSMVCRCDCSRHAKSVLASLPPPLAKSVE